MASRMHPNLGKFTSSKFDRKENENLENFSVSIVTKTDLFFS